MTLDTWISIANVTSQTLIAAATFWLGWRVYRHTRTTEAASHLNAAIAAFNQLNTTALSSDENLLAIDSLFPDGRDQSLSATRKRWATFLALQTHQQLFLAEKAGMFPSSTATRLHGQVLDLLISDAEVLSLATGRGFDEAFSAFCNQRAMANARQPTTPSDAGAKA